MVNREMAGKGMVCKCGRHHKVIPILVILMGLAFLSRRVNVLTWGFVGVTWPILVIIGGVMKLCGSGAARKERNKIATPSFK